MRRTAASAALALAFFATGCTDLFGPDYSQPNVPDVFEGTRDLLQLR